MTDDPVDLATMAGLAMLANPGMGQYFLTGPDKLAAVIDAAGVRPDDRVVELGAGVGTVAAQVPPCAHLTAVELDGRLVPRLMTAAPAAAVVMGDALRVVRWLQMDVLLSNLPHEVTHQLLDILPTLKFRTAVLAVAPDEDLDRLHAGGLEWEQVTVTHGADFTPFMSGWSQIVRVWRAP